MKFLVRPDVRVYNTEAKDDTHADQLSYSTVILKQGQAGPARDIDVSGCKVRLYVISTARAVGTQVTEQRDGLNS